MKATMNWNPGILAATVLAALPCAPPASAAEDAYPARPVRIVAPFPPGSGVDIIARIIGQALTEVWKQSFIVENRSGAGGTIGSDIVAKAPPDGYTLLLGNVSTLTIAPNLYRKLPYDPVRDFAPITVITVMNSVLVVHPSLPARSLKEFVALAKAKPRSLNYGSAGSGTTTHLGAELFKSMAGVDLVHVPYKGSGAALTDLLAGQVQAVFGTIATVLPQVKAGKLRALGVTSLKRTDLLPDVPSINEALLPGFEVMVWQGIVAPARTPDSVIARLHSEIVKSLRAPAMKEQLTSQGLEGVGNSPKEFGDYIRSEYAKWGKVVKVSGATVD
ncbi:MAG TPA: tripartite tricarboxylate transporter substrate binding protein [Burkholderiales bacterium]|nr:tripartite tricarboxylate transporter substrate binding protein [Burkholderiales bacterium]